MDSIASVRGYRKAANMASKNLLGIYLNDHLAIAIAAERTARRSANSNRGTALGDFLGEVAEHLHEQRTAFETSIRKLGISPNVAKKFVASSAEILGRLKLNGRLRGYSPLSRLIEVEALAVMSGFNRAALVRLAELRERDQRLEGVAFEDLLHISADDAQALQSWHQEAAREVLG